MLQVTMKHAALVGMLYGFANLNQHFEGGAQIILVLLRDSRERLAARGLHRQEVIALGSHARSEARRDFLGRTWGKFPEHRHYSLQSDGTFESWVNPIDRQAWKDFLDRERNRIDAGPRVPETRTNLYRLPGTGYC